jgi:hypothetical protein
MASAAYQSIQVQIVDVYDGEWPGAGRGVAAAVLAGDVSLRGRGVLLRGEQAAGRRVHALAMGTAPLQPPQVTDQTNKHVSRCSSRPAGRRQAIADSLARCFLGSTRRASWRGCAASG